MALTRAMAVVIMLPPDPPMTRTFSRPLECRMVGAIEDGGCSPIEHNVSLLKWENGGKFITIVVNVFNRVELV